MLSWFDSLLPILANHGTTEGIIYLHIFSDQVHALHTDEIEHDGQRVCISSQTNTGLENMGNDGSNLELIEYLTKDGW